MITKDLAAFAETNWTAYKKPVSVISRSNRAKPETALVDGALEMFDFDGIVESLFGRDKCKSADAFYVGKADAFGEDKDIKSALPKKERKRICLYLIEFKRYDEKDKRPDGIRPCALYALNRLKVKIAVQDPKYSYVYQNPYIYDAVRVVTPLRFLAQTQDILREHNA